MTCLEAQSNIMAFVEKKLPDDKVKDFVKHMKNCPNCSEELEIYYTLIIGMRELDNNEELSQDFKKELNEELNRINNKVKKVKRFKVSSFSIICATAIAAFFLFYNSCLIKAYNIEQRIIKDRQGQYYFYDNYSQLIELSGRDLILENTKKDVKEEDTFYKRIHIYNIFHQETDEMTETGENN